MTNYLHYKRQLAVLDENNGEIESWITVRGNHIPIKKGQSKEDAVKSFLEHQAGKNDLPQGTKWSPTNKKGEGTGNKPSQKKEKYNIQHGAKISDIESMINAHADKKAYKSWKEEEEYVAEKLKEEGVYAYGSQIKEAMKNVYGDVYTKERKEEEKVDKSTKAVKNYKNTMSKIRGFKAKSDGTYDFETGKPKDYPDGYSVSFHQNEPDDKGNWKSDYGRYSDEDYDKNVSDMVKETGGELNIGYFAGTPEVSVWVKDFKTAVKMAKKHNQHSIWDWKAGDVWINPDYDPKKNPMKQ